MPNQQQAQRSSCWCLGARFLPARFGQYELCPPFQRLGLGMPSTRSLWPGLMGTGRPGPPAWWGPVSYFGHVYGWDMVPSWTLKSRGGPGTGPGWPCLHALPPNEQLLWILCLQPMQRVKPKQDDPRELGIPPTDRHRFTQTTASQILEFDSPISQQSIRYNKNSFQTWATVCPLSDSPWHVRSIPRDLVSLSVNGIDNNPHS